MVRNKRSDSRSTRRRGAVIAVALGAAGLCAIPLALQYVGGEAPLAANPAPAAATAATSRAADAATAPVPSGTKAQVTLTAGSSYSSTFTVDAGQGLIDLVAWAPGTDWQTQGSESASATISVDGKTASTLLVPGAEKLRRQLQLGDLTAGAHTLTIAYSTEASAPGAHQIALADIAPSTVTPNDPGYVALAHAPILYGRSLPAYGGAYQNSFTDAPLVAWHYATPNSDGTTTLEYQYVWSNEDGGTDTNPPNEMFRWGRMTDIEWIYRVTVDAQGKTVPGTETFQAPSHTTTTFAGAHEGEHPVMQTCTDNNNICDTLSDAKMRFFLSAVPTMDAKTQAREQIMDTFGWTYAVMGKEMIREQHTEAKANADTAELSDARNFLYVVINKTTSNTTGSSVTPWIGAAVGVQLKGSNKIYRSDHAIPAFSLDRDGLDATAVELPAGTKLSDIKRITAIRISTSVRADPGYTVTVNALTRAYLLQRNYQPGTLITAGKKVTLTEQNPTAVIYGH